MRFMLGLLSWRQRRLRRFEGGWRPVLLLAPLLRMDVRGVFRDIAMFVWLESWLKSHAKTP